MKTFKDFLNEAKEPTSGILKKDNGKYSKGEKLKILSFKGSGLYHVEFEDGQRDTIGKSNIEFSEMNEAPRTASVEFHKQNLDIPVGSIGVNVDGTPNKNITIIGSGVVVIKEGGKVYISYYNQFDNEVSEVRLDPKTAAQLKKAL